MQDDTAYRNARRHVERKIGFFMHLAIYLVVNTGVVLLNLLLTPRIPFALGPLLGWGIGLLFHGLGVFLHAPGSTWKRRMIEHELKKCHPTSSE